MFVREVQPWNIRDLHRSYILDIRFTRFHLGSSPQADCGHRLLDLVWVDFRAAVLGSLNHMWLWLSTSEEIARGYSAAMSIEGGWIPLGLAGFDVLILVGLWYGLAPVSKRGFLLFVPGVFFAFKEGFVRQDDHRAAYFIAVATIPVVLLFCQLEKKEVWRTALCFVLLSGTEILYAATIYLSLVNPSLTYAPLPPCRAVSRRSQVRCLLRRRGPIALNKIDPPRAQIN